MPFLSCLHKRNNKILPNIKKLRDQHQDSRDSNSTQSSTTGSCDGAKPKRSAIEDEYPEEISSNSSDDDDDDLTTEDTDPNDMNNNYRSREERSWKRRLQREKEIDYSLDDDEFFKDIFDQMDLKETPDIMHDVDDVEEYNNLSKVVVNNTHGSIPFVTVNGEDVSIDDQTSAVFEEPFEIHTLLDVIESGHRLHPRAHCVGERDPMDNYNSVKWITYDQIVQEIEWFASGLLSLGMNYGQESRVAIYAANSPRVSCLFDD